MGIILIAIALVEALLGGWPFAVLVALVATIMYVEWTRMVGSWGFAWKFYGFFYCLLPAVSLLWIRERAEFEGVGTGFDLLIWVFLVVWSTDIGAYFAGRAIGGPKLAPSISPNKTIAGLIGGVISAAILAGAWVYAVKLPAILLSLAVPLRGGGAARRFVRKRSEAAGGRQGQRNLASRPWRPARPARRAGAGCRPDRGPDGGGLAMTRRGLSILGATGSVGTSTLDLVERNPDRFEVIALTAASNVAALADAARRTSAKLAVIDDPRLLPELEAAAGGQRLPGGDGRRGPGRSRGGRGRMGDGGDRRLRGPRAGHGRDRSGADRRAGQQGIAGHGRRS